MLSVRSLMTPDPDTVGPLAPLHAVLGKMNRGGWHHLPVVEDDVLVGIVTDRDVRLAVNSPLIFDESRLPRAAVLESIVVSECMSRDPVTVEADAAAWEAADILAVRGFGALPVLESSRLVGILTVTDFLRHYADGRI